MARQCDKQRRILYSMIFGKDPFGPVLDRALAGETIGGKKSVVARRISTPQESGNCQILFLSSTEEGRLNKIIEAMDKEAILTVSEYRNFLSGAAWSSSSWKTSGFASK